MRIFGYVNYVTTPGTIPYASLGDAQAAIAATLTANYDTYTPAEVIAAYAAVSPTSAQQAILLAINASIANGDILENIGGGTIGGSGTIDLNNGQNPTTIVLYYYGSYIYVSNTQAYNLYYSIRKVGSVYYVDKTFTVTGGQVWAMVTTSPVTGDDSYVWMTTLIQNLKLSPGESPFYAKNGIPAQQSVITQIFPDYYVAQLQQYFSQYFSSLQISRVSGSPPTYQINAITFAGVILNETIAV